ncbi:hypothetical protein ACSW8S_19410 (plasmid) [Clostridium perfringens]
MGKKIESLVAENYSLGRDRLENEVGEFEIVGIDCKRKWLIGPKYCEISYVDLRVDEVKAKPKTSNTDNDERINEVVDEIESLKYMVEDMMKDVGVVLQKASRNSNDILNSIEDVLVKNGVHREIAQSIIKDAVALLPRKQSNVSKSTILLSLKDVLNKLINTCEGYDLDNTKTIMLVGPTGVGKTTTLAKLASILYGNKKDVGLITLDTYKVGAIAQLEKYGEIMNVPVESCNNLEEFTNAVLKYMDKDCILIDTAGQNQKNLIISDELREMVDIVDPDQLSLVLSATTKTEDLYDCIEKFSALGVNSIIITKIDETNSLGEVINIAYKYPAKKIAYFTNGQNVPSDIEGAKSEKIIKSIING